METIKHYISIVSEACTIAEENFNNSESIQNVISRKNTLIKNLEQDSFIKIPFVGDFSAGKSSLINSFIGQELLPTNICPETAVSYELYFSTNEYLEVWHESKLKETALLSQISVLKVAPGDIVRIYLNNEKIKQLNAKGIVIVDMPGIDSGIEAHNNAILNYIQEGTFFIIVLDAEQGALRNSTITFIEEIKKYNISASVIISKADKKPETEIIQIKSFIEGQAKRFIGETATVGVTSTVNENHKDLNAILESLNATDFLTKKYASQVSNFIKEVIAEIQLQIKLMLSDKKDFPQKINQLEEARERALNSLKAKSKNVQSVEDSAKDILDDIYNSLQQKKSYLATLLFNSQNDTTLFNAELLSIVRPTLVSSFKREISEYQDNIGNSIKEFSLNVNDILQDKNNGFLDGTREIIGNLLGKDIIEEVLKKGLDELIRKLVAYKGLSTLLKTLSKVLGPLTTIVFNIIPDILCIICGKSKETKIAEITQKLDREVFNKIVISLKDEVIKMLEEQRQETLREMENIINEESKKYDANINEIIKEQELDKKSTAEKTYTLQTVIGKLNLILTKL